MRFRDFLTPRNLAGLLGIALLVVLSQATPRPLPSYAREILQKCRATEPRSSCYDKEIPALLGRISMTEAFRLVRLVQSEDPTYWFCHLGAHAISAAEYARRPAEWQSIVAACPAGMCSNGCIHGAIQAHFAAEALSQPELSEIEPLLRTLCEPRADWHPTPQEISSCNHEIGHLAMYLAGGDVARAGAVCDAVAVRPDGRNYAQTCHEGVTMQVFQPVGGDDFALIYPLIPHKEKLAACEQYDGEKKSICWRRGWEGGVQEFCGGFSGDLKNACLREGWVTVGEELERPEMILAYCSYAPDDIERKKCFNKIFYGLLSRFLFDESKMERLCRTLPGDVKAQCFANTASRLIETDQSLTDRALAVCARADAIGSGDECFRELLYYASFVFSPRSERQAQFCEKFPPTWREQCLPERTSVVQ